ncbi:MAG: hypothetical protein ACK559_04780, partial [bacterium]
MEGSTAHRLRAPARGRRGGVGGGPCCWGLGGIGRQEPYEKSTLGVVQHAAITPGDSVHVLAHHL